jgi:hypothetical protein
MVILFTSFDGEPPRSCVVAYANPRYSAGMKRLPTIPILQNRYGQPKLHFAIRDDCPEAICNLDALKKLLPSPTRKTGEEAIWNTVVFMVTLGAPSANPFHAEASQDNAIWHGIVTSGCAIDSYADAIFSFPFFVLHGTRMLPAAEDEPVSLPCPPYPANKDCGLDYTYEWRRGRTRILVGGAEFLGALTTIHFVDYPLFWRLQTLYSKFYAAAKHQQQIEPRSNSPNI